MKYVMKAFDSFHLDYCNLIKYFNLSWLWKKLERNKLLYNYLNTDLIN